MRVTDLVLHVCYIVIWCINVYTCSSSRCTRLYDSEQCCIVIVLDGTPTSSYHLCFGLSNCREKNEGNADSKLHGRAMV